MTPFCSERYDDRVIFRYLVSQIKFHWFNGDASKMESNFNKTRWDPGSYKLIQNSHLSYAGHANPYVILKNLLKRVILCGVKIL